MRENCKCLTRKRPLCHVIRGEAADGAHFGGVLAPWLRQRRGRTGFGQNLRWERLSQTEVFSPSAVTRS